MGVNSPERLEHRESEKLINVLHLHIWLHVIVNFQLGNSSL